jgi:hypothetical protein
LNNFLLCFTQERNKLHFQSTETTKGSLVFLPPTSFSPFFAFSFPREEAEEAEEAEEEEEEDEEVEEMGGAALNPAAAAPIA